MIIRKIQKHAGIAGQFSVSATVEYPDEPVRTVEFVGSTYGGPVVMRTAAIETFVTDPGRFGKFGTEWVRRFFETAYGPEELGPATSREGSQNMTTRVRLTRAQRRDLIKAGRAYQRRLGGHVESSEIGDYLMGYMLDREAELGLCNLDAMNVSDYAYGVAHWIVGREIY